MGKRYFTANPVYYGLLKHFAEENRNHPTAAESLLWHHLSNNKIGLHFRRQHIIGCYIADFVCLKKNLIIEVDGGYHSQQKQVINDYLRTQDLNDIGFTVMRFRNEDIESELSDVLDKIFNKIAAPQ